MASSVIERPQIIAAKFSKYDVLLIDKVCQANAEDRSSFLRRSVRRELARLGYYSRDVKKALGIEDGGKVKEEVRSS